MKSPLTEEEEGMESQHKMENNAITYSTNNHIIKTMESQEMENAITYTSASSMITNNHIMSRDVSRDDKEEESLPQDLSMISNRNVDS